MSRSRTLDALDMEFQYYSCLVKDMFLMLPNRLEQRVATAWIHKLSSPVYNADALREKRNHYLLMLTICMTLNGLRHPFDKFPPDGTLQDLRYIRKLNKMESCAKSPYQAATEEQDDGPQTCDLHDTECPKDENNIGKVLDEQFKFLINLARPHVSELLDPYDRRRGRKWITYLSSIDSKCFHMKAVRNDYAMLLSGYLINDELPGPFLQFPIDKIVPLEDLIKMKDMNNHMSIDPSQPKTLKFFRDVPLPEEGAFAFIAVSGEICATNVK